MSAIEPQSGTLAEHKLRIERSSDLRDSYT
jgi:hypothetical protein